MPSERSVAVIVTLVFFVSTVSGSLGPVQTASEVPPAGAPGIVDTQLPTQTIVDPLLTAGYDDIPVQVAILVIDPAHRDDVYARLDAEGYVHHTYPLLSQAALKLPASDVDKVASWDGVKVVWRNEEAHLMLNKAAPYVGADVIWNTYKLRGDRVGVMVVDTGIDGSHPDLEYGDNLKENVVPNQAGGDLLGGSVEGVAVSDVDGHGTHVAGIVGGTAEAGGSGDPDAGKYRGVSWGVDIVGYQAGVENGNGEVRFESTTVLEAFEYALQNKDVFNLRIITNSWGTDGNWEPHNPINQATFSLYRSGFVVTFAAGNEGAGGHATLNKYCVAPWVLCVAAGDYLNRRAPFSSMGTDPAVSDKPFDHPDIMAPGVGIKAAKAVGDPSSGGSLPALPVGGGVTREYYTSKSGTSMATPVVAGAAALLIAQNRDLSPDNVYDILVASATPFSTPLWEGGAGYLNVLDAYRTAQDVEGNLGEFKEGKVKYGGKATGDPEFADDPTSVGLGIGPTGGLRGSDTTPSEFADQLVGTPMGLAFLAGTLVLAVMAFAPGRARRL